MRRTVAALGLIAVVLLTPTPAAAQEPPEEPGPVRQFIQTIGRDFKSMASHESVPVLSTAAAFALLVQPFDATLSYSASCSTFLKTTFDGWSRVAGQEWLLASGALGTYVTGRAIGNPRVAQVGRDLLEAEIVAGIATTTLKVATSRTRPDGEPRSFPSGHAAGTFAVATVIQRHFGWKGAVPAYTAAFLISGARMQHYSHYPTDVIAGAALGILAGRAATVEIAGARVSASPALLPGGGAITFSIRPDKE